MLSPRLFLAALVVLSCDPSTASGVRVFRVNEESLSLVSLKTGVSVARLRSINHLTGDALRGGTGLLVPQTARTLDLPRWRPPLPAPEWKACEAVEWLEPVARAPTERCRELECAGEACLCLLTDGDSAGELSVGQASWGVDLFLARAQGNFRSARVDLDGDGAPESLVSVREGVGNGLGVEWWRHMVVKAGRPLVSFVTIDYGASFVAQPRGCALLATSHQWRDDQLRGEGSYWVARLHLLQGEAMRAVGPEVVRRYTHRFAAQRWAGLEPDLAQPLPWFTDVGAFVWPQAETRGSCRQGSVVFEDDEHRFDLGELGVFAPREGGRAEPLPENHFEYDQLLDAVTGAPLLDELRPFGEARWTGRKVTVCEGVVGGEPHVTLGL